MDPPSTARSPCRRIAPSCSSIDLQGIDNAETIEAVHAGRAPRIPVNARLRL
jgi:hypothetical protein